MIKDRVQPLLEDFRKQSSLLASKFGKCKSVWKYRMLIDLFRFGAKPVDYVRFEFYRKSNYEKNRYMSSLRYSKLYRYLQNTVDKDILKSKAGEYIRYKDFIKRKWMLVDSSTSPDDIRSFVNTYHSVIVKPDGDEQGNGIFKLQDDNPNTTSDFINNREGRKYVMEQVIESCGDFVTMNPSSLNTIRMTTMIDKNGNPIILSIMLRIGRKGQVVDNWGAGGLLFDFDVESGICCKPGLNKKNEPCIVHPDTGFQIIGFKLPDLEKLKAYTIKLCEVDKKARFVGWDIAYVKDGFDLVEVNIPAGHEGVQAFNTPIYDIITKNW